MLLLKSKKLLLTVGFFGLLISKSFGVAAGDYQTFSSGNWNSTSTWSRWNGAAWINPAPSVPVAADGIITILSGHTVTVTASVTLAASSPDQFTINSGGILIVNTGITFNIANGVAAVDLTVAGTIINHGTITPTGAISFSALSLYNHCFDSSKGTVGAIPVAAWATTATCEIDSCGNATTGPTGLNTSTAPGFGNFTWSNTTQSVDINLAGFLSTINGSFSMTSTGAGANFLALRANLNSTTTVTGNYTQTGGVLIIAAGTATGTGNNTFTVNGTYTQSAGTCILSSASTPASANNGNGTITVAGATSISSTASLIFSNSSSTPAVAGANGAFNANGGMTVSGGTVNLAASSGDGSGGSGTLTTTTLIINGTGVVNLSTSTRTGGGGNGTIISNGLLTLQTGGTINGSTLNGNGSVNANAGFTMTGGTVNLTKTTLTSGGAGNGTFNVTGACNISAGTFNLNSSAVTGTTGAIGTLTVSTTLNISGTALVNFNSSSSTGGFANSSITVTGLTTISGGTLNGNTSNAATTGCNTDFNASGGLTVSGGVFNVCSSTCTTGSSAGGGNTSVDIIGATIFSGTGIVNLASGGGTGSGGNIATMNCGGTFTMNAGTPSLNLCSSSTAGGGVAGSGTINVTGNFSHTLPSTTISKTAATNTGTINITGAAVQTIESTNGFNVGNTITFNITQNASPASILVTKSFLVNQGTTMNINDNTALTTELTVAGTLNNSGIVNVNTSAILDMGTTVMSNAVAGTGGFFNLINSSGFITKHAQGITTLATGAFGCIQVTGGRTYSIDADYTYNGTAAQATGNGLPVSLTNNASLTINNTSYTTAVITGVTLTQATTLDGILTMTKGILTTTSTNLLTLGVNATNGGVTPGNQAGGSQVNFSFVNGPLKKIGTTAFVFPTGDVYNIVPAVGFTTTAKWARIEMAAPTTPGVAFTAEYHKINDPCPTTQVITSTNIPAAPYHVSYKEYWDMTETGTDAPKITLYWEDGNESTSYGSGISSATAANLHVAECIALAWNDKGVTTITGGAAYAPGKILSASSTFTSGTLMYFTFGTPTAVNPLPIELLSFNGFSAANGNQLNWSTATETNNNYFDLERSSNANEYSKIATINGAGNSTSTKEYSFIDNHQLNEINYYRLKQVDYNGDFTYSNVISIDNINAENSSVQVYPNPSNDIVNIISSTNITEIMIYNMMGELVYSSANNNIQFSPLSKGIYVVKALSKEGNTTNTKFVKN
jgi:hypothetical protein